MIFDQNILKLSNNDFGANQLASEYSRIIYLRLSIFIIFIIIKPASNFVEPASLKDGFFLINRPKCK